MAAVAQVYGVSVADKLGIGNGRVTGNASASGSGNRMSPLPCTFEPSRSARPRPSLRIDIAAKLGEASLPGRRKAQTTSASNSAVAPLLEITLDSSAVPSDWHSPDLWKDTLANLPSHHLHDYTRLSSSDFIRDAIAEIRDMLKRKSLGGGEISVSAYDTAWVAMVPALDGSGKPQFPKCLDWIVKNQFEDGSWGEGSLFSAYDRALSTVACVVALETWGMAADTVKRGCDFVNNNMHRIADEQAQHMPIGFEMVFPPIMDLAQNLGLDLPYDSPITKSIVVDRQHKLTQIAVEVLHAQPSTLLYSLEGIAGLVDWKRMMKLQATDGSMLYSPASTACALMHTGDDKSLEYLINVLETFDNAVPNVYPVHMLERLCVVDRLERLGIAHHFQKEIQECLDNVYKDWAKESLVTDLGSTAMGFQLLRLHGYDVSEDVFLRFKQEGQFAEPAPSQSGQAVRGMFNLYRASQTLFPGETILEQARAYSRGFLEEKLRNKGISDKWDFSKDLPGEVECALTYPFFASLPRMETRSYLDQYGPDDIWIGKSLYKMPFVNNLPFLTLAKADFNYNQLENQRELEHLVRWNAEQQFSTLPFARQKLVECYFSGAATMYEPELKSARKVWTQSGVLSTVIDDYFDSGTPIEELAQFQAAVDSWDPSLTDSSNERQRILFMGLYNTVNAIAGEAYVAQGRDIKKHLINFYKRSTWAAFVEAQWAEHKEIPQWDEYMATAELSIAFEPPMLTPMFFVGEVLSDAVLEGAEYKRLGRKANVIGRLLNDIHSYKREASQGKANSVLIYRRDHPDKTEEQVFAHLQGIVDSTMQQLTYELVQSSEVPQAVKKLFYHVARNAHLFYKDSDGYTSVSAMKDHVKRLLFEPVV